MVSLERKEMFPQSCVRGAPNVIKHNEQYWIKTSISDVPVNLSNEDDQYFFLSFVPKRGILWVMAVKIIIL